MIKLVVFDMAGTTVDEDNVVYSFEVSCYIGKTTTLSYQGKRNIC